MSRERHICELKKLIPLFFSIALIATNTNVVFAQNDWKTFRNSSLRFRFLYPPDWIRGKPRGANVKASFFAPKGSPRANCNIVVRPVPETKSMTQEELNKLIMENASPSKAYWKKIYGHKWSDVRVFDSRKIKVDNQPAYLGLCEFSHTTLDRKTFTRNYALMAFTPGYVWVFTCMGKGNTIKEARISFKYWKSTFQRILGSLVFERW